MKLKKGAAVLLAAAFALSVSGCGGAPEQEAKASKPGAKPANIASSEASSQTGSERDLRSKEAVENASVDKFNAYISVNNIMTDRMALVIESYFKRIDFQEEFVMISDDYFCNSLGDSYLKALETAHEFAGAAPAMAGVDESFEALYPVLKELMETFDAVYNYSELKSYVDDDYAKAKEYHAVIWKNMNQYDVLAEGFMTELGKVADERRKSALKSFEESGMVAHYAFMSMLTVAQEIQSNIYEQGISDENLTELDLTQIQPLYDEFVKQLTDCFTYMEDEEQLKKEGWQTHSFSFMESDLRDLKVGMTDLIQRVKEQKPLQDYELNMSRSTRGSVSYLDDKLGDVIDSYNRL